MISSDLFAYIQEKLPGLKLLKQEPMAAYTTFRIGGPAAIAFPGTCQELTELYRLCLELGHRPLILGAGSNVLAPDEGLERLVICTRDMSAVEDLGGGRILAQCGATLTKVANFARDLGLTGLEFAQGIPGTVGGGVYMNAGAYGGELCQTVAKTIALLPDGTLWEAVGVCQGFGYRHSAFADRDALILQTEFQLSPGDRDAVSEKMKELAAKRRASQPLEWPSAGSTFKRPVGGYAAALIDQAGLKGFAIGGAEVSEKHAGFVINRGGATADDVKQLMTAVQQKVLEDSGIILEPEVRIW